MIEGTTQRVHLGDDEVQDRQPRVVCVSRLDPTKHPEDVIVSVAKARERHPQLAAVIVGDGPIRDELVALCTELGIADDVVFAGARDQHWIARMLTQAAVVAAPLGGLSLVEAALAGKPIVAYDHDWHTELLEGGRSGLLIAYRDTDAMGTAIGDLLDDPALAARLAAGAREQALERMDPAKLLGHERAFPDTLLATAASA